MGDRTLLKRITKELSYAVERYRENDQIDTSSNKLTNLITMSADRLKNERTFELERARMYLTSDLLKITQKPVLDEKAINETNFKKKIIEEAINLRRSNQKRYNVERN